jgi:hypothetical protein
MVALVAVARKLLTSLRRCGGAATLNAVLRAGQPATVRPRRLTTNTVARTPGAAQPQPLASRHARRAASAASARAGSAGRRAGRLGIRLGGIRAMAR